MKILLSWLKDFIDVEETPEKIAEALMMSGIEIESVHQPSKHLSRIVVGKIESVEKHPNADKLSICTVNVGTSDSLSVVCGAPNAQAGKKVPVALLGATLPSGFQINKAKIRGVESCGMLCSKRELGISDEHSGLFLLPDNIETGTNAIKALKLDDVVFEASLTPNRGDALSHLGIARELSAIFNLPFKRSALPESSGKGNITEITSVTVEDAVLCRRYGGRIIRNVKIGPSPDWLIERLEKIGLRSINNVVDITNFIMYDIGHPMHAFDMNRLDGKRIVVRSAKSGETITALDGIRRTLQSSVLVIADACKPVAIAGVMGGLDSSVTEKTTDLFLEAAVFDPVSIRKTAKALSLTTDSSYRFERGVNIDNVPIALNKAVAMIIETAGGEAVGGLIDAYHSPEPISRILLRPRKVSKIIGLELAPAQIETYLLRLKFEVKRDGETLLVGVPPFRHDIETEADLIEEIARLHGYSKIPESLPAVASSPCLPSPLQKLESRSRDHLISLGFSEMISFSFIPKSTNEIFHEKKPMMLVNPISEEHALMRTSLLYGMYDAIKRNVLADEFNLRLFEIGKTYSAGTGDTVREHSRLCIGICAADQRDNWRARPEEKDIYYVKGIISSIAQLQKKELTFTQGVSSLFHPAFQFEILFSGKTIGMMGMIHPKFLDNKKMPESILLAEIDLGQLSEFGCTTPRMKPIPLFPPLRRDLAFIVPIGVQTNDMLKIFRSEGGEILDDCFLFDVYQGKGIDLGNKSMAFSMTFRRRDGTLTDEDVQPRINSMIRIISEKLKGKLR